MKPGKPLPLQPDSHDVQQVVRTTDTATNRSLRVLLVEDHIINQKLAINLIERAGHQVTLANNGEEGLRAAIQQDFDLIFMDMQMPVMDGLEATRAIRAFEAANQRQRVRIVAMTANAMASDQEACERAGMDAFLSKPFKADDLRMHLRVQSELEVGA
jgi:CheY-like chemotaxis protein